MLSLTKQEKLCLLGMCFVLWTGYFFHFLIQKYPNLKNVIHFIDREEVLYQIDINTADYDELIQIPYIGAYTAEKILKRREELGRFSSLEEIAQIPGIYEKNKAKFMSFLKVSYE